MRDGGIVAFGNVMGSDVYNVLNIVGVTALVHPIPPGIASFDAWVALATTGVLIWVAVTGKQVRHARGRLEAPRVDVA